MHAQGKTATGVADAVPAKLDHVVGRASGLNTTQSQARQESLPGSNPPEQQRLSPSTLQPRPDGIMAVWTGDTEKCKTLTEPADIHCPITNTTFTFTLCSFHKHTTFTVYLPSYTTFTLCWQHHTSRAALQCIGSCHTYISHNQTLCTGRSAQHTQQHLHTPCVKHWNKDCFYYQRF